MQCCALGCHYKESQMERTNFLSLLYKILGKQFTVQNPFRRGRKLHSLKPILKQISLLKSLFLSSSICACLPETIAFSTVTKIEIEIGWHPHSDLSLQTFGVSRYRVSSSPGWPQTVFKPRIILTPAPPTFPLPSSEITGKRPHRQLNRIFCFGNSGKLFGGCLLGPWPTFTFFGGDAGRIGC